MHLERFISYIRFERRFSPHTVLAYEHDIQQFLDFLRLSDLDCLSAKHIHARSWIVDLMDDKRQAKTINRKLSALRSFYKFLIREKLALENPVAQIKAPKIAKTLPVVIDSNKLSQFLDGESFGTEFSDLRDKLIMEMLFGTGMRLAELVSLSELNVDLDRGTLKVLGKRSKERIIPLNTSLKNLIALYINEKKRTKFHNNSDVLLVTSKGKNVYPQFIYRVVKKNLEHLSTQKKKSPHTLRHTFATALLDKGADINAIKELLGHSSLAATQVYTHNSAERLKSVYKQAHPKA